MKIIEHNSKTIRSILFIGSGCVVSWLGIDCVIAWKEHEGHGEGEGSEFWSPMKIIE